MNRIFAAVFALTISLPALLPAQEVVIFEDDFETAGLVDQSKWRLAFGGDGSFFGQTQLKTNLLTDYPVVANGVATLQLDTYLDDGMGASAGVFYGHEIVTKRNFTVGGGLRVDYRARLVNPDPGLVGGMFVFDVQRLNEDEELVRDEIDFELLSNTTDEAYTNFWNEGPFTGPASAGDALSVAPGGGFDITAFHDYRIEWYPDRIEWYVDGNLVRTANNDTPDDPVRVHINLWVPDASFAAAYDANLLPATSAANNVTYEMEVDEVVVTQLNTEVGANDIGDGDIEDASFPYSNYSFGGSADGDELGEWIAFNNVFISENIVRSGTRSFLMFGPFNGNPDASGVWQNVAASPGEVLEASVFAQTPSNDSIKGNANFASMSLQFYDANGDIIPGLGSASANGKENIIMEGRDPECPEDTWVQRSVTAVAPAGTAQARLTLLFIQVNNEGGAVYFDDLSINRITAVAQAVDVAPDTANVTRGTFVSGTTTELSLSDNADFVARRSTADIQSRVFLELKSTSPAASPAEFSFTLEGSVFARSQVLQIVDLFNYNTNAWEEVDSRDAMSFFDAATTVTPTGDLSRFVEAGTNCIEARVRFQSVNPRQRFTANIDQTIWTIR